MRGQPVCLPGRSPRDAAAQAAIDLTQQAAAAAAASVVACVLRSPSHHITSRLLSSIVA